jgi:hypothetical protein
MGWLFGFSEGIELGLPVVLGFWDRSSLGCLLGFSEGFNDGVLFGEAEGIAVGP